MSGPDSHLELELPDPQATRRLGQRLAPHLTPGLVVALTGDLGAGKTSLCKAAIAALGGVEEDDVVSPTFVLASEYPGRVEVLHLDAYRLPDAEALEALGFGPWSELGKAVLIEWADRVEEALPPERISIHLEHTAQGTRRARISASGVRGLDILRSLSPPA